ncbi:hypothetical protein [Hymenobacter convexus]|uniref:hypothetical protein n=1 Tax=Hymenobacter sp. CA1UV-4 TaxID=3063782 RepID=UPI002713F90F|nr:hypothetical protein [Hymenobacter sp. CA1UV-4]MDO7853976.1 hypothetical protein [Hymenobacter sp. CA1UV-4]
MKNFWLLTIVSLSISSKAAGQAAAPTDLSVTAEIVHAVKSAEQLVTAPQYIPYIRLSVRNQTTHDRDVAIMSCGWDNSWTQKGNSGLCGAWGCDKNFAKTITIPVGQALVFCAPLCGNYRAGNAIASFSLGFIDFAVWDFYSSGKKKVAKTRQARTVYWSNELASVFDLAATPEVTGDGRSGRYYLAETEK